MKAWLRARHRGLFIRSYVVLAGGLLIAAIVLDLGFNALQSRQVRAADPWLESTFRLVAGELAALPPPERSARARQIGERLGLTVQLLETGDITGATSGQGPQELEGEDGRLFYLWQARELDGALRIGPFEPPRESVFVRLLPVFFYGSILLVVGLWLRPLLRDLRVLTAAAQRFATDYREPLVTARETSQLTGLATHLDEMSARISQLIQTQKEMTAALSHEMRTPLARVRFAAAVLEGQVDERWREQLRAVNADVQQIDDLIADMLDYARLDHPGMRMDFQAVPVAAWLRQVVATAPPHQRQVEVNHPDLATAWMEPRLLELAAANLLANALRYARQRVRMQLTQTGSLYQLAVEDDGEGIPEVQRQAVFRAFTRLDNSRNRETGGFGLGLAIVARIALLHRGRAVAGRSEALGGAKLVIEWPAPSVD